MAKWDLGEKLLARYIALCFVGAAMPKERFSEDHFRELVVRPHHAKLIEDLKSLDAILSFSLRDEFFLHVDPGSRWVEAPEKSEGEVQRLIDLMAAQLVTASTREGLSLVFREITEHRNRWREELRCKEISRERRRDLILGVADLLDLRCLVTKTKHGLLRCELG